MDKEQRRLKKNEYMRKYNSNPSNRLKKALNDKKYRENNLEKLKIKSKRYSEDHKDKIKIYLKNYFQINKDKLLFNNKKYVKKHKRHLRITRREYDRKRCLIDINYKLRKRLRTSIYKYLKNSSVDSASAVRDLGCSIEELKIHLEKQFQEGMTWDNWKHDGWHIDHIKPLASFDLNNPINVKIALNYKNLQPLWAADNWSKSDKF